MSPDPAGWGVVDQTDPQSLDRYAYVENQPLNLVDPAGLNACVSSDGTYWNTGNGWGCPGNWTDYGPVDLIVGSNCPTCFGPPPAALTDFTDGFDPLPNFAPLVNPTSAPNNPAQPNQKNCGQILKSAAVTVGLDAAGTFLGAIPGAGAGLVTAQVVVGLAGAANSAYHGDIGGTMAGTIGGAQLSAVAAGAEQVGWTSLKTFGGTAARALPWIGSAVSAYYFYKDATEALDKYQACKAGIGG